MKKAAFALAAIVLAIIVTGAAISRNSKNSKPSTNVDKATSKQVTTGPKGTVWVANEDGNSISAINTASGKVRLTIEGVEAPHNIQTSTDGQSVWTVSGHDSKLFGFDAQTGDPIGEADTPKHPAHVILSPDDTEAYVTGAEGSELAAINLDSLSRRATSKTGKYPHGLRASPNGKQLLVANMKGESVSLFDRNTMKAARAIPVGDTPIQVAWMPDNRMAFVSLNAQDAVVKIDTKAQKVVALAKTDFGPAQTYITSDGERLLVANQGTDAKPSDTLAVYDTNALDLVYKIKTGSGAHGITTDNAGNYAFVTNMFANEVVMVDLTKEQIVWRSQVGKLPNGISYSATTINANAPETIEFEAEASENDKMMDH